MKTFNHFFFIFLLFLTSIVSSCQQKAETKNNVAIDKATQVPLLAKTTSVFIDNADKGEYATGITIESGTLKVGQQIDAVGNGKKYSFTVKEIKVNDAKVNQVSKIDNAFVILQTNEKADQFNSGFTIVNYDATSIPKLATTSTTTTSKNNVEVTADFNSKKWSGASFFNSNLFYAKGLSMMNCEKAYLMLAFQSNVAPDNRQLTFTICGFEAKVGKVNPQNIEVSLSGAESGDSKLAEAAGSKGKGVTETFVVEITKYEKISNEEILISGKFSGTLGGVLAEKPIKITNGVFTNVKVKVFNTKY